MRKKNLLYIFADQWRNHAIGFQGQDSAITPNIDKFANEAVVFENAISTYPLCSPHRSSLFSGKYPYKCGVWTNCKIGLDEIVMLKPQERLISDVLKQKGYDTAYIGKWHLDASEKNFCDKPKSGAIDWDAYTPPGERRHNFDFWYSYGAMDHHLDPHYWQDTDAQIKPKKWSPEIETDVAIEYLQNRETENPFCMFISWNPPHLPYDLLPQKYYDLYENVEIKFRENVPESLKDNLEYKKSHREYLAAVTGIDENFGRILKYLDDNDLTKDTIIVLSSDHGDMLGSQGLMGKNIWYEESINIPFMVKSPDLSHHKTQAMFSSVDHMPTLLDMLDVEIPETVDGVSFKPMIEDYHMENEPQEVFISMIQGTVEGVAEYQKHGLNNKCFGWRGLRTKTNTYIIDNGVKPFVTQKRYLYDNVNDPFQLNPLDVTGNTEVCKQYDEVLAGYLNKIGDPFLIKSLW